MFMSHIGLLAKLTKYMNEIKNRTFFLAVILNDEIYVRSELFLNIVNVTVEISGQKSFVKTYGRSSAFKSK